MIEEVEVKVSKVVKCDKCKNIIGYIFDNRVIVHDEVFIDTHLIGYEDPLRNTVKIEYPFKHLCNNCFDEEIKSLKNALYNTNFNLIIDESYKKMKGE